ncbi:Uu.00g011270.m01.CDS01 [Anthostomella pinea]|uniref:Uu.00g011270.m01.CDS01 n=1 Tax=Anthostomella pinea TaxID=933095 RepID=A0AAI8YQ26_9PEZI|nr:Uu.00g011270.m01.CDS01 [Anthostomella pinea]
MLSKDSSILIIGAGTWGCSIALELARNGYTDITVLDGEEVPSSIAAGNDVNKIMEEGSQSEEDTDSAYAWNRLHDICTEAWLNDPLYKPFYHRTGYVMAASSDYAYAALLDDIRGHEAEYQQLDSAEGFRRTMPEGVLTGDFKGWRGFSKPTGAGWVFARGAVVAAKQEAEKLGARFITGHRGDVVELLFETAGLQDERIGAGGGRLQGVKTADGTVHTAHTTILANGANADFLLDLKYQLRPTAWTLAHIKMTPEEAKLYKDLPVLFHIEKGFFMEPTADTHELKICDEHPGYINPIYSSGSDNSDKSIKPGNKSIVGSRPFAKQQIPLESEARVRAFLRETMPQLAERPFSFARICWDADTPDRMPLIDWHPSSSESESDPDRRNFLLAVGGSGHCFKTMPAMGRVVREFLEGRVDERTRRAFRWRPETAVDRDWWDVQDRWGADGKVIDFGVVKGWTSIGQ